MPTCSTLLPKPFIPLGPKMVAPFLMNNWSFNPLFPTIVPAFLFGHFTVFNSSCPKPDPKDTALLQVPNTLYQGNTSLASGLLTGIHFANHLLLNSAFEMNAFLFLLPQVGRWYTWGSGPREEPWIPPLLQQVLRNEPSQAKRFWVGADVSTPAC